MNEELQNELKYPIGPCHYPVLYTDEILKQMLLDLETFPQRLEFRVQALDDFQLQTRYREGGWTVNQVIHHCADSHMNCLIRLKLTLTEDRPTIKPYLEDRWAEEADYSLPYNNSLTILHAVHRKILKIIRSLSHEQLDRTYFHPEYKRDFSVKDLICLYAWHGNHHLAHITNLIDRMSWNA